MEALGNTGAVRLGRAWKIALSEHRGRLSDTLRDPDDTHILQFEYAP